MNTVPLIFANITPFESWIANLGDHGLARAGVRPQLDPSFNTLLISEEPLCVRFFCLMDKQCHHFSVRPRLLVTVSAIELGPLSL